jgi:hypothetical protein
LQDGAGADRSGVADDVARVERQVAAQRVARLENANRARMGSRRRVRAESHDGVHTELPAQPGDAVAERLPAHVGLWAEQQGGVARAVHARRQHLQVWPLDSANLAGVDHRGGAAGTVIQQGVAVEASDRL